MHRQLKLFLCGDVMCGRGVDQLLPHPSQPHIFEPFETSALSYVELAERVHGPLPRHVAYEYVWGDALRQFRIEQPHARIVNLETSITTSEDAEDKGINYRMHPENMPVLDAAGIDCCVLANNHVLDWGMGGLIDTLEALGKSSIREAGAGRTEAEAEAPAVLDIGADSRVLVFGLGAEDSGIPPAWAAGPAAAGVNFFPDLSDASVARVARAVERTKRTGDIAVASIHWGDNWGYEIPSAHRRFARGLIDRAAIDVVHGHSSHHPMGIEIYRNRPILYGCGDFLNDYEGISGQARFRADLVLMYFVTLDAPSGELARFIMTPLQIHRFRLRLPSDEDRALVGKILARECEQFGHRVVLHEHRLMLD